MGMVTPITSKELLNKPLSNYGKAKSISQQNT